MSILAIVMFVFALVFFIVAIFNTRTNWIALGLAFVVLAWLLPAII